MLDLLVQVEGAPSSARPASSRTWRQAYIATRSLRPAGDGSKGPAA